MIIGGETGGRWLGGFDRSLRAVLLSLVVSQTLGMLASKENAADLESLRGLIEAGEVTPAIDRTYPLRDTAAAVRGSRTVTRVERSSSRSTSRRRIRTAIALPVRPYAVAQRFSF